MDRRNFLIFFGAAAALPLAAAAQQAKRARIAWFTVAPHPYVDGFRRGMRELGWVEGENLLIEYRYADGHPERLPELAAALARSANDLVVVSGGLFSANPQGENREGRNRGLLGRYQVFEA